MDTCSFISALSQEDNKQSCSAKVHVVKPNSLDVDFVICAKAGEWDLKCFVPSASRNCVLWLQTVLGYAPRSVPSPSVVLLHRIATVSSANTRNCLMPCLPMPMLMCAWSRPVSSV